ncbi:MAG TPA: DUF1614 domain-containing protein [Burkholderiales bacterium]|nr:DUF1614 domain-containing protein [Burkholderiales bacterium]
MRALVWLSLAATAVLVVLLPWIFAELMAAALAKLHLRPGAALALIIATMVGGLVNIPIKRIRRSEEVIVHPLAVFGLTDFLPELRSVQHETVIAVNVGGCLVPAGLALYELAHLVALGSEMLLAAIVACIINIAACYLLARPVPRIGIALALAPECAAPVAYVAGVIGPLVGADLLHLKNIERVGTGMMSIGGAGTFDRIVLSGIVAAYLS